MNISATVLSAQKRWPSMRVKPMPPEMSGIKHSRRASGSVETSSEAIPVSSFMIIS